MTDNTSAGGSDGDDDDVCIESDDTGADTVITIAVFSIAFVLVGVLAPQIVAIYAPQGHYIEIHGVETYNTTTNATSYTVKIDRTVHHPTDGTILMELMRVENGTSEQAAVFFGRHYFSIWEEEVYYTRPLPDTLKEGTYYWVIHIQVHYSGVERSVTARSSPFTVTNMSDSTPNASETEGDGDEHVSGTEVEIGYAY